MQASLLSILGMVAVATAMTTTVPPAPTIIPTATRAALERRQSPVTSLFAFTALPSQVYPKGSGGIRGDQSGTNQCPLTSDSATHALCQTLIFNGPVSFMPFRLISTFNTSFQDDFCLWGAPGTDMDIANEEANLVAYCTKQDHGARLIPPGTITGMQVSNVRFFYS
jgi:hypothetical protein